MNKVQGALRSAVNLPQEKASMFFKTGTGHYAEGDKFIGVTVPALRKIAKEFANLTFAELETVISSPINEERLLALIILANQYKKASAVLQNEIYQFYLSNLRHVNNWNLVDSSAHLIIGAHLFDRNREILLTLANSPVLWERRIAIVATWYFIRNHDLTWTFKIAELLLNDKHDLIHKATGWMLREAGKKDELQLIAFLDKYSIKMPKTMLRYAKERLGKK